MQKTIEQPESGASLPPAPCCASCGDELDDEEKEYPRKDEDGDPICDRCYTEKYEGVCDRCGEIVEKKELAMNPGELTAFWEEVDGLKPGYYRVLRWPIYMDGMIEGYVLTDNLQFVAKLDKKGKAAAKNAWTPGGRMCCACRDEIQKHNTEVSDGGTLTHESPAAQSSRSLH